MIPYLGVVIICVVALWVAIDIKSSGMLVLALLILSVSTIIELFAVT